MADVAAHELFVAMGVKREVRLPRHSHKGDMVLVFSRLGTERTARTLWPVHCSKKRMRGVDLRGEQVARVEHSADRQCVRELDMRIDAMIFTDVVEHGVDRGALGKFSSQRHPPGRLVNHEQLRGRRANNVV